ncbi:hypothetical protein RM572_27555 [Streptomyces sp. DSM 42041]|uniref:Uncharacterized protein n=1 Tax=Streptomyces hazeniae TaxID=3075538 RepID=A0ABU2P0J2_9ACTN|nr:hypothetical protein [Streptomyces sp. DSM 42041]MDT0382519.1 hypothetical protein [Streptomyces sp. DSM 42041]
MSGIHREMAEEVARRQGDIRTVVRELREMREDDPRWEALLTRLSQAGEELLEYEAAIPERVEAPHRKVSVSALRSVCLAHMAGGVVLGLAPLTGWVSWWWLVLAVFQLVVGFLVMVVGESAGRRHRRLRVVAVVLGVVTVLVPLCVFSVVSSWVWLAVAVGWVVTFGSLPESDGASDKRVGA